MVTPGESPSGRTNGLKCRFASGVDLRGHYSNLPKSNLQLLSMRAEWSKQIHELYMELIGPTTKQPAKRR